jgi:hypothetical protein
MIKRESQKLVLSFLIKSNFYFKENPKHFRKIYLIPTFEAIAN